MGGSSRGGVFTARCKCLKITYSKDGLRLEWSNSVSKPSVQVCIQKNYTITLPLYHAITNQGKLAVYITNLLQLKHFASS